MDQTADRGYPYPECDPPLTKDASDIAHLFNLAQAVAEDVQGIYDRSDDVLVRPDAARRLVTGTITDQNAFPAFTTTTFDSTSGAMTGGAHGGIELVEPGWYMVGAVVQAISTTFLGLRLSFIHQGIQASSFGPQAAIVATNVQNAAHNAWIFTENPNTVVTLWVRNGAASPNFAYSAALWANQVAQV